MIVFISEFSMLYLELKIFASLDIFLPILKYQCLFIFVYCYCSLTINHLYLTVLGNPLCPTVFCTSF